MSLSVKETIEALSKTGKYSWGINTVMGILRPGCLYELESKGGNFVLTYWEKNQWSDETQSYIEPPTSQEIRDEYIRQQTIAECLEYFENEDK